MALNVCFYATERGDEPVRDYLDQISENDAAGIMACMSELQKIGYLLPPFGKKMSGQNGLYEITYKKHRVLYSISGGTAYMLVAFRKQSKKTPKNELKLAKKRMQIIGGR